MLVAHKHPPQKNPKTRHLSLAGVNLALEKHEQKGDDLNQLL